MMSRYAILDLPSKVDGRGSLTFAQVPDQIPFVPQRIFTLYDLAPGAERGGHAHRGQHQLLIAMHGIAEIDVDDGEKVNRVVLDTPIRALHVPPLLWLTLRFPAPCVCAVLASGPYDEADYIRHYNVFLDTVRRGATR